MEKKVHIGPDAIIIDVIARHRATEGIFKLYDDPAGKSCVLCQTLFEPVEDFARKCNLDLEQFIAELNDVITEQESTGYP